jgi:hypothetical protein
MNDLFSKSALPVILLAFSGCATQGKPPPSILLDEPVQAQPLPEAPKATLNKPSKISAQTWMTQFFGLLCLSRGPFGQFAGR